MKKPLNYLLKWDFFVHGIFKSDSLFDASTSIFKLGDSYLRFMHENPWFEHQWIVRQIQGSFNWNAMLSASLEYSANTNFIHVDILFAHLPNIYGLVFLMVIGNWINFNIEINAVCDYAKDIRYIRTILKRNPQHIVGWVVINARHCCCCIIIICFLRKPMLICI